MRTSTTMIGGCERGDTLKTRGTWIVSPFHPASETPSTRDTLRCDTWKRCCQSDTTERGSSVGIPRVLPRHIHSSLPLQNLIQADTTLTLLACLLGSTIVREMTSTTEFLSSEREGHLIDTKQATRFTALPVLFVIHTPS